tara:strand:- start:2902 stop:3609 length:708 start_codon:yes stop_codon:yes gene_type:complete
MFITMKLLLENWRKYLKEAQELEARFGLILKLEPPTNIDQLIQAGQQKYSNILPEGEELTKINISHVTLISGKMYKELSDEQKQSLNSLLADILPEAIVDDRNVFLAAREMEGRKTLYVKIQNSDALNQALKQIIPDLPNKYMHMSIANVHGGDPFKSVGDINETDEGEQKNIVPATQQQKKQKPQQQKKKGPNIRAMAMGMLRAGKSFEEIQAQIENTTGRKIPVENIKQMIGT